MQELFVNMEKNYKKKSKLDNPIHAIKVNIESSHTLGSLHTQLETTKVTDKGGTPKRGRFNTIARPGLKVYAAPRRIPPIFTPARGFLFIIFLNVYK